MYERNKIKGCPYPINVISSLYIPSEIRHECTSDDILELIEKPNLLTDRQRDCIKKYFRDNITYKDIGISYHISKERVRQDINLGLSKIQKTLIRSGSEA